MTTDPAVVHQLAAAIDAIPSVVARSTGPFGVIAAYLPGERIDGIRRTDSGRWEVHVVMAADATVSLVQAEVLRAAARLAIADPIDLFIDDIADRQPALPPADPPQPAPGTPIVLP